MRNTIIIICIIILVIVFYNYYQRNRSDVPVFYKKKLIRNYNARTVPPFGIFIKDSEKGNKDLLNHELVHWEQYRELGLLKYYGGYLTQMGKYGYDKMPMEIEARGNESEYCKKNYTECVRSGVAKTIHNPKFRS